VESYIAGIALLASVIIGFAFVSLKAKFSVLLERCRVADEDKAQMLERCVAAETELKGLQGRCGEFEVGMKGVQEQKDEEVSLRFEAEKQLELARREVDNVEKRMADWEKTKEESLLVAKEAN